MAATWWVDDAQSSDGTAFDSAAATKKEVIEDGSFVTGDRVFVLSASGNVHSEGQTGANISITGPQVVQQSWQVIAVTDFNSGSPADSHILTDISFYSIIDSSDGVFDISLIGEGMYWSGLHLKSGDLITLGSPNSIQHFRNALFELTGTSGNDFINVTATVGVLTRWDNVFTKVAQLAQQVNVQGDGCDFHWRGGGIDSGSTIQTVGCIKSVFAHDIILEDLDLTKLGSNEIIGVASLAATSELLNIRIINCNIGSAAILGGDIATPSLTVTVEQSGADQALRREKHTIAGNVIADTGIVLTGGWADEHDAGSTPMSYKVTPHATMGDNALGNFAFPSNVLRSFPMYFYNATEGSSIIITVEILHNYVGLDKRDCWLEARAITVSATESQGSFETGQEIIDTNSLATSGKTGADWSNIAATEVFEVATLDFTPQVAGYIEVVLCLAKFESGKVFYFDPLPVIS